MDSKPSACDLVSQLPSLPAEPNTQGFFSFPELTSSTYTLEVVVSGFRRYSEIKD